MKPQQEPSTQEVLAGLVERVTFHNDDNGFYVLRIKARGHRELITVVGHAATISSGEWVTVTSGLGFWRLARCLNVTATIMSPVTLHAEFRT
jgi:exodeoxyribonuclease V alpha subunit